MSNHEHQMGRQRLAGSEEPKAECMRWGSLFLSFFLLYASPLQAHITADPTIQSVLQGRAEKRNADLRAFYATRGFVPAWSETDSRAALAVLAHADEQGLTPTDYIIPEGSSPAERDVLITVAVLSYIHDLRVGRPTLETIDPDVALPAQGVDAVQILTSILNMHNVSEALAAQAPPQAEYARLKAALAVYRAIGGRGGWAPLPTGRPEDFTAGGSGETALRHRLQYEDTSLTDESANLAEAIERFQSRHGVTADGRVGPRTLAEMNVPASARIMQIAANMERWRWLPRVFEPSFIAINVPDARLTLILNGKQVLESRVVVGRPHDPTPILRAEGAGITINPPWNVPASIARRELLPKLKKDPSYLLSQNMVLVNGPPGDPHGLNVNWRAIPNGTFPYRVQQHPGPRNSLGTIKIELPNRFDVYLHDTPAKGAFNLPARDISHGCVRVQQILPLASYALAADLSAISEISGDVAAGQTKYLPLHRQLPVYFLYWTAFGSANGDLQFRPDIYGRDQRLMAALHIVTNQQISANLPKCLRL